LPFELIKYLVYKTLRTNAGLFINAVVLGFWNVGVKKKRGKGE
jgi:hypothetical protein